MVLAIIMAQKANNIFTLLSDDEDTPQPAKSNQRKTPATTKPNVKESLSTGKEVIVPDQKRKAAPVAMDRKSRTGRGPEAKKGGAGPHNWGTGTEVESEVPPPDETKEDNEDAPPQETQPEFITMSEWLGGSPEDEEEKAEGKELLKFRVNTNRRGRRGGRRGDGGQQRPQKQTKPDLQDSSSFPSLT